MDGLNGHTRRDDPRVCVSAQLQRRAASTEPSQTCPDRQDHMRSDGSDRTSVAYHWKRLSLTVVPQRLDQSATAAAEQRAVNRKNWVLQAPVTVDSCDIGAGGLEASLFLCGNHFPEVGCCASPQPPIGHPSIRSGAGRGFLRGGLGLSRRDCRFRIDRFFIAKQSVDMVGPRG
jgi:hypothetical protein